MKKILLMVAESGIFADAICPMSCSAAPPSQASMNGER